MAYRQLFLFVEGADDERFFKALSPLFMPAYDHIAFVQTSQMRKDKLAAFVRSVNSMTADYLVVRDLDRNPCVTAAKSAITAGYPSIDPARVQIVRAEIESWYCAGVKEDDAEFGSLPVAICRDTSEVTKEDLNAALGGGLELRIPAMIAMLERFDPATAARRNASFRYFLRKHLHLDPS